MKLQAHPDSERMYAAMTRCQRLACNWSGTVYRTAGIEFATQQELLSGAGSESHGGRWNPPGVRAVYGCLDPVNSFNEALAHATYFGIPVEECLPVATAAARVMLNRVLDLRDLRIRRELGVTLKQLLEEDWRKEQDHGREAVTQAIGRAAFQLKLEGLLVPSRARSTATNIVVFPQNLEKSSSLVPIHAERLPRHAGGRRG